ncbi:MAG: winged helix-turn-helix transcriptional regulator, partial [Candidatus Zixiibacteriota bacterium]
MADLKKMLVICGLDDRKYSKYFKAFGDTTRQKILVFLSAGEKTVNEIAAAIGVSQPTTSRH